MLIDGYNVIHADDAMRRLLEPDSERARAELVERLGRYVQRKQMQVTIVFDGTGRMLDSASILPGKLQIVFSRGNQTADELIVSMLEDAANPREFVVVTSDNAGIGKAARALGASVMSSNAFLERLSPRSGHRKELEEKPDPFDDDIDYWMREFNRQEKGKRRRDGE
ncbi:MAG: NYN domain-containing protein [Chitinivibrionia bacterium]|nr:NYN domain-containing protein [Chitinivibrionia bacterium]